MTSLTKRMAPYHASAPEELEWNRAACHCRLCIIAGDISPVDVITPLPVLCEDNDIPYIYVPSKEVR